MRGLLAATRRIWIVGGWAPLAVFTAHVLLSQAFDAYALWPQTDTPMHFAGGLAIAFFVSRCFRALPRETVRSSRMVVLELVLVGSLTATAALFWELAEFGVDQLFGSNVQVSLANTMKDLVLGMAGALTFLAARARQLRASRREAWEIAGEWLAGRPAGALHPPAA